MRVGVTMRPERWLNDRERLFNPEAPPSFQWPETPTPNHGLAWDFLKVVGLGVVAGLALVAVMTIWLAVGLGWE